ncbi:MAG: hypothetical protein ACRYF3_05470 [Janthinobacterium lividum]
MDDYRAWKTLAPTGLLLVGLGVSVIADAAIRRSTAVRSAGWIAEGTVGLVAMNSGISLFGEAVKRRAVLDVGAARHQ